MEDARWQDSNIRVKVTLSTGVQTRSEGLLVDPVMLSFGYMLLLMKIAVHS